MDVRKMSFEVSSGPDMQVHNITDHVRNAVIKSGLDDGIVSIFIPGSTGGVTTTEFEPNLNMDLKEAVERLVPSDMEYHHHKTWGDENGKSHVRASIFRPELTVPFAGGKLTLGTWQQIVLLDFDVPARTRKVVLTIMGE